MHICPLRNVLCPHSVVYTYRVHAKRCERISNRWKRLHTNDSKNMRTNKGARRGWLSFATTVAAPGPCASRRQRRCENRVGLCSAHARAVGTSACGRSVMQKRASATVHGCARFTSIYITTRRTPFDRVYLCVSKRLLARSAVLCARIQ